MSSVTGAYMTRLIAKRKLGATLYKPTKILHPLPIYQH